MPGAVQQFTELAGERLLLRPLTAADYTLYTSLYGDDNILRYIAPAIAGDKLQSSFNAAVCKRSFLVVELKQSLNAAGILGITVTQSTQQIEVGVIFKPEFQKQHLAYEALQVLITFLCNQYLSYNIIAEVNLQNRAAVWLAKRLGFGYNQRSGLFELDKQHQPR
jgi:RimJ/RimL family protein N-acetyltransferase